MAESSEEFKAFVGELVPLTEAQSSAGSGAPFADLAGRIARGRGDWSGSPTFLYGGGMMTGAAVLAALLPGQPTGSFWRVGRHTLANLLNVGNTITLPLLLLGVVSVLVAWIAVANRSEVAWQVVTAEFYVGMTALAVVGLLWVALLAFAALNFLILLLIGVAIIIGTVFAVAIGLGMLAGLADS